MEATKETTYGAWVIIGVEGRAAWARCRCGTVRQLALRPCRTAAAKAAGV